MKLAKRMKKNNMSVDIIAFGDLTDENLDKLRAFNEAVKGGDGSHLAIIPPGPNLLSDSIVASPILAGEGGGANGTGPEGSAGGAGAESFEFGVDPNMDPELALVLRMSMEEERERIAREQRQREEAEGKTQLESVPEEGGKQDGETSGEKVEVDGSGEAAGSASSTAGPGATVKTEEEKKKDDQQDHMDTA